jgi:hypothetical protein
MSGRRRDQRFAPGQGWDGALQVLRDVHLQTDADGTLVAIAQTPAMAGENLNLDLAAGDRRVSLRVQVVESRPVIVEGHVRHRITLVVLERVAGDGAGDAATL